MAVDFDIQIKDAYILVRPPRDAIVNEGLVLEMFRRLRAMEAYQHGKKADLWDLRGCNTDLDFAGVSRLMDDVRVYYDVGWTHERTAVVADAEVQYGLSRIYQALVSELPIDFRVFRDFDEAVAWIEQAESAEDPTKP